MNGAVMLEGASTLTHEPTLLLLAALFRRLLSLSRRQPSSTYLRCTTRDFVVAVSLRACLPGRSSSCVCFVAHTPTEAAVSDSP